MNELITKLKEKSAAQILSVVTCRVKQNSLDLNIVEVCLTSSKTGPDLVN